MKTKELEIRTKRGKIISFKEFKDRNKQQFLKYKIPKKDILDGAIFIKAQLEEAVKKGLLREISFRNRKYFIEDELIQYTQQSLQLLIKKRADFSIFS